MNVKALEVTGILFPSIFLAETDASILERSEHGGGNVDVVHELGPVTVESVGKEFSSLDCSRGKLKSSVLDVADSVNVGNIGLFLIVDFELTVRFTDEASILHVDSFGKSVATNSEEYGVEAV